VSYARKRPTRQRYRNIRGHRVAMGGFFDDLFGAAPNPIQDAQIQACLDQGNAAAADADAKRQDLAQNWNPNGFYAPADMNNMISLVFAMLQSSESMLEQVSSTDDNIKNAQDEIFGQYAKVQMYQQAIAQAKANNQTVINAPGFKDWVISAMGSASAGITAAVVTSCNEPWWVDAMSAFQSAFDAVWNAAKKLVGVVLKAADTVLTIADNTLDIAKYLPYAAAAVGAYILFVELGRYKRRRA